MRLRDLLYGIILLLPIVACTSQDDNDTQSLLLPDDDVSDDDSSMEPDDDSSTQPDDDSETTDDDSEEVIDQSGDGITVVQRGATLTIASNKITILYDLPTGLYSVGKTGKSFVLVNACAKAYSHYAFPAHIWWSTDSYESSWTAYSSSSPLGQPGPHR